MSAELKLVTELAIILISAGVFTVIFKALKQPLILGYIVAGFVVGPHLGLFPQFSPESVHEWSELGIIFLLFGLGLEFNFKKLLGVGSSAIIAALTICIGMFLVGSATGAALHWTKIESIFLGGMLSMSSTTIIIKAYDDLGIKHKPYATLVFGLLVVEDLLAVLMMVLFSTLAVSNKFSGIDMLLSLCKLVAFLVLSFVVGIYVLPSLLKRAKSYLSDEILLLISVGLCFLMVVFANAVGFSSALGAFLMGSVLSSTIEGEHIEHITVNVKNLFGAIFFVSVGMMVDPVIIAQYWKVILVLTLVAMTGILLFSTGGTLLAGKNLDTAVHVGFSLPQLGEFSFIIAGLGTSLGVISDFIYPVIISVSVITTFTTPYMIKAADPVSAWLHRILPPKVLARLSGPQQDLTHVTLAEQNVWKSFFKKYFIRIGIYSMILIVLLMAAKAFIPDAAQSLMPDMNPGLRNAICILVTLLVMLPFIYGIALNDSELREPARILIKKDPKARIPIAAAVFLRIFLATGFVLAGVLTYVDLSGWFILGGILCLVAIFFVARVATIKFTGLEDRFMRNLQEKDNYNRKKAPVTTMVKDRLAGYDIHIESLVVPSDFSYIGKTLREIPFRHNSGVNIVKIQRGSHSILVPSGNERIYPGDHLLAVGTSSQIDDFIKRMQECSPVSVPVDEEFTVEPVTLTESSELTGKMLSETGLRPSGCLVISVLRDGVLHTNPTKEFVFNAGDTVWVAGLKSSIDWIRK